MNSTIVTSALTAREPGSRALLFARTVPRLHAMISSAGWSHERANNYDWHGLRRGRSPWALIQVTLDGEGRLDCAGRAYTLRAGQAMLLHMPHDHRYWLPTGGEWRFFYLCLHGSQVLRIWRAVVDAIGPLVDLSDTSPLLQTAGRATLAVLDGQVTSPWQASRLAYDVATALGEMALPARRRGGQARRPPAIARAIDYAREHFHESIGATQLAEAANLSRAYFTRLFTASEGQPPGEFLTELRMQHAAERLRHEDRPVADVARACGYRDTSYFGRVFRRTFQASPRQFRHSGMY
ncbi:MAG: helix-turn-helix domain-containing protein [Planctomycetes bacterium]|jgi:AraC-like DNA-binding protein|nr:AraC family transcriptional regulator [Phycisphaerae bacterium]NBB95625.1 helix-turn-helix domain-containing protein [Planctomycetota bacterium]